MSADELIDTKILIQDIEQIKHTFEFFRTSVDIKAEIQVSNSYEISEELKIIRYVQGVMEQCLDRYIVNLDGAIVIDLREIDKEILSRHLNEELSFYDTPLEYIRVISIIRALGVFDQKNEFVNVLELIWLSQEDIINRGINSESLATLKADFDFLKNVIFEHEKGY